MKSLFLMLFVFSFLINDLPINEAKLLIAQKKYQEAIQVLSSDNSVKANYYRGFCYFHLGNCSASTQALNSFIQSENKYQSESWKNEARTLILKCQNNSNNTAPSIAINETKKTSKIEQLKTDYQKSFTEISNALNKQNKYEDSIKFVETNGLNIENKNLKSFITKANDISIGDNLVNKSGTEEIEPTENIITPKSDPKQEVATVIHTKPIPDIAKKEASKPVDKSEITVPDKKHHYKILFTIENQPDKTFMSLTNIGPVTNEKANGNNYIYYIGFYPTKENAEAALPSVKSAGFAAARVLEFNKGALEKEYVDSKDQKSITDVLDRQNIKETIEKPVEDKPMEKPKIEEPKIEKKEQIQEVIKSDVVSYHILFRVLPNPYEQFDDLKKFGPLYRETFDAKGNSRYLIGNTDDINVAKQLLEKVKKAGYPASFVAEYVNGQLSKIIQE